ncbi:MAG: sigma-54-dependent Fis family transcriptional regulator [Candidatus Scalindua sp. AMX11]|nr:MAG: sigma-54-dependent Fis family transcriptional regulator [Candidatus Scalindua sp.]NOG85985.1 sigma-54-dependent Fis family transcriptional regulator [Planctomycetota bacterium]RZV91384.1 MAG: sigma-54-dependent Fis family transcriptional regulator [Candidatus Scalindua sp. SCAELEC01]TDE65940.1 MAG: sigma-54-dependent Fis family transcriptional regulator [Candidatus Scalindua sp. AMX11]GJQ59248.1 MAG: acetoacetate metabolism regulatory protein AtoC [Candidatus Scalindua sp.]
MISRILVADDEERMIRNIGVVLGDVAGTELVKVGSKSSVLDLIDCERVHLVITDLRDSRMGRLEFLKRIKSKDPELPVIIITGDDSVEIAVEAMKEGAFDYISRPFEGNSLAVAIKKAIKIRSLIIENRYLRHELESHYNFGSIISNSPKMLEVLLLAGDVSRTDSTVSIFGESGTGKELVARAIHFNSLRKSGPLITINCAALPENLLESELFGYEKGAFTGAEKSKKGRFELANGGTLFLDEISEMNPVIQAKVLRVVEERELERLGGSETIKVDVRIICASNRDLALLVKKNDFREDLFYRINVFPIQIPPLRERSEDILSLVNTFIDRYSAKMGKCPMKISKNAEKLLISNVWEGNIRELKNCIERAVILCKGNMISEEHLPLNLVKQGSSNGKFGDKGKKEGIINFEIPPEGICLEEVEKQIVLQALKKSDNNKTKAAKMLGLTRGTLRYRLEKYCSN